MAYKNGFFCFLFAFALIFLDTQKLAYADISFTALPDNQGLQLQWSHATAGQLLVAVAQQAQQKIDFYPNTMDQSGPDGMATSTDAHSMLDHMLRHTSFNTLTAENDSIFHIMAIREWPMDGNIAVAAVESPSNNSVSDTAHQDLTPTVKNLPSPSMGHFTNNEAQMQNTQNMRAYQYNYILYATACYGCK